jgi:hypothetical protein
VIESQVAESGHQSAFETKSKHIEELICKKSVDKKIFDKNKMHMLSPYNVPAIPKTNLLPKVGVIQPLPGVSYLATSPGYYEMIA